MPEHGIRRTRVRHACAALLAALLLAACATSPSGSGPPSPDPTSVPATSPASAPTPTASSAPAPAPSATPSTARPTTSAAPRAADAVVSRVSVAQWSVIVARGAWHRGCPVGRTGLRRVEVNFHGFDGHVHRGVLVVNADVASSVAAIFTDLFDHGFPIHRMQPIEAYGGDDDASMAADNTSAYNCRTAAQANAPAARSPHAHGRAVDLNPYENPWIDPRCGCFQPDSRYGRQRSGTGVVTKGGVAWTAFTSRGWIWQNNATTDFQHFDTGYPSRPLP